MRRALTRCLAGASRRVLGTVLGTAVAIGSPSPALAGVEGEIQNFMADMGAQANVTGPSAYQGQSAGYYSGGAMWARFPQKNIQPFNIQLPHATSIRSTSTIRPRTRTRPLSLASRIQIAQPSQDWHHLTARQTDRPNALPTIRVA